jgi:hypothetical protein
VASGNFLKVPLLVGSTQHEGDILAVGLEVLSPLGYAQPFVTELFADLLTYVRLLLLLLWISHVVLNKLLQQAVFTCPAGVAAEARTKASVPAWRYQYQGKYLVVVLAI